MKFAPRWALLGILGLSFSAAAGPQVGTITRIEGDVTLLTHPSGSQSGTSPRVKYQSKYYTFKRAKLGDRLANGNVIRAGLSSKARVIYDNGDQINIAPGTSYSVTWNSDTRSGRPKIKLKYGKIRAIIEKGGPRSRLRIRSRSATMGVRGTDFYIADDGMGKRPVEVSVLRGKVEVQPKAKSAAAPTPKKVEVKSGQTADIAPTPPPAIAQSEELQKVVGAQKPPTVDAKVEIRKTSKEELVHIQKETVVKKAEPEELERLPAQQKQKLKKVEKLEKEAVKTVLKDIKKEDPKLYAKLSTKPVDQVDVDQVNVQVVQKLHKVAPKAPPKVLESKPFISDFEGIEAEDSYNKYFNSN